MAKFEIDKEAFNPKSLTCCNLRMKKAKVKIIFGGKQLNVSGFKCNKCKKTYVGLEAVAKKYERIKHDKDSA